MQRVEMPVGADETHCITRQGHRTDTEIHVFTSIAIVAGVKLMNVADLDVKWMKVTLQLDFRAMTDNNICDEDLRSVRGCFLGFCHSLLEIHDSHVSF